MGTVGCAARMELTAPTTLRRSGM
uniref:Uncharacterized protein n=1 Tax=Arundo donax TaxID=35708 RepID=A0A0A9A1F5_ARUDO